MELAGAGCPIVQLEEPNIHLISIQRGGGGQFSVEFFVDVFNNTVKGLRDLTEVWCHTCWGNPAQQRLFATNQSYREALPHLNKLDVDVITFECCTSDGMDLEVIGRSITDKKIAIGVVDHRNLQVERPEQVADLIRRALKHIPVERLVISSDCGFGREGMLQPRWHREKSEDLRTSADYNSRPFRRDLETTMSAHARLRPRATPKDSGGAPCRCR